MKKIIALGGSNSRASINKKLAVFAANKIKGTETIEIDLNNYELPLYGVDVEQENGIPDKAKDLSELIKEADGLVISLAEHNGSYSAAFKNTIDWLSRIAQKLLQDKPILLMATSPGARGGATVLQTAKSAFPFFGGTVIADFSLPSFFDNFSEDGLKNEALNAELEHKVKLFQAAI